MSDTLTLPFKIGDMYWLPSRSPRQTIEPCPVCKGTKMVTVLSGDERFDMECDACGLGYKGPRGTVTEWHYDPHVEPFTIDSIVRMDGDEWTVKSVTGGQAVFSILCATEAEALDVSAKAYVAQEEENTRRRRYRRKGVSKAAWTVRYHQDAIKRLERELAYHRGKIGR